jgi:hypothetical protein
MKERLSHLYSALRRRAHGRRRGLLLRSGCVATGSPRVTSTRSSSASRMRQTLTRRRHDGPLGKRVGEEAPGAVASQGSIPGRSEEVRQLRTQSWSRLASSRTSPRESKSACLVCPRLSELLGQDSAQFDLRRHAYRRLHRCSSLERANTHVLYLSQSLQLEKWQNGNLRSAERDCMRIVSKGLL